ncbi:carboxypeptidase S [[Candida] anglica]|uniref:Carboxypeptidase S n=1 Tax=[Candida] anglica TaxID=148631 RepID=A0ABP0EJV9_9ASCO
MVSLPNDENDVSSSVKSKLLSIKEYVQENWKYFVSGLIVLLLSIVLLSSNAVGYLKIALQPVDDASICPMHEPLAPESFYQDNSTVLAILRDEEFRLKSVKKLAGAVQINTTVTDNQPDVPDAPQLWESFGDFHLYLQSTFPKIFTLLDVDYVNTYGIVIHWKGSNSNLKPVMLTAHQDVVPVQKDTLEDWSYPPFEGHYDGQYLYGRGSSDCKNILIAILEAIELLIEQDFKPQRGVLAVFGFDEEASGLRGAFNLSKYLEKRFGKDSIYAIVDEGSGLMKDQITGQIIAMAATGEKGYADLKIDLTTPGGHSSVPPDHTSIGLMSEVAYLMENDKYEPILSAKNPMLKYIQCLAVNTGDKIPKMTRKAILRAGFDKLANSLLVKSFSKSPLTRYLISTSQSIDLVRGGEKANALPEAITLVANHRVAIESNIQETKDRFVSRVQIVAEKYGLGLVSFGKTILEPTAKGTFEIDFFSHALEPAPVSPSDDTVWKYLAGVTRHVFEDLVFPDLDYPLVVAPAIMPANTDTRYYWNLTKNIYRYTPAYSEDVMKENHIHSVDERVSVDAHLETLAFFYEYVQAINTPDADNS